MIYYYHMARGDAFLVISPFAFVPMSVGFGDSTPLTDVGKMAVALYAILAVNVFGSFLEPARRRLEEYCRVKDRGKGA